MHSLCALMARRSAKSCPNICPGTQETGRFSIGVVVMKLKQTIRPSISDVPVVPDA